MVEYQDIVAELTTEWNASIIALPNFYDLNLRNTNLYKGIYIGILNTTVRNVGANAKADIAETFFSLKISTDSRSNLEKLVQQVRKIIKNKTLSGGIWTIESLGNPEWLSNKRLTQIMYGKEIVYRDLDNWD